MEGTRFTCQNNMVMRCVGLGHWQPTGTNCSQTRGEATIHIARADWSGGGCASGQTDVVRQLCEGRGACGFTASRQYFRTDCPAVGHQLLTIWYVCRRAGVPTTSQEITYDRDDGHDVALDCTSQSRP
jgi:hypothetical protein